MVRAPRLHRGCQRFESSTAHHPSCRARVALDCRCGAPTGRRSEARMEVALIVILVVVVIVAIGADPLLQRARPEAEHRRRVARPDRGPAQATPRPGPEPRERRQGLHGLRAGRPHEGHQGAGQRRRRRRPGASPSRRPRRTCSPARCGRSSPWRRTTRPQGERERALAPGAAHHDREPDQLRAAVLQLLGPRVQHGDPDVPRERGRRSVRVHQARLLRRGARGSSIPPVVSLR